MPGKDSKVELAGRGAVPSNDEAAAVIAALETMLSEVSRHETGTQSAVDPWRRAALLEGVGREGTLDLPEPWIKA